MSDVEKAVGYLRSPLAIRARCEAILDAGLAGKLAHFRIELDAMPRVVDKVVEVTRRNYPDLQIPVHGRINHFGKERVASLALDPHAWVDLIVVSVLLDAGAGDAWRFRDGDAILSRSEGLAVASLRAFEAGLFSTDGSPRVDAEALRTLAPDRLAAAFQVSADNPLAGVDGRIGLVRALGDAMLAAPQIFASGRPGGLVDYLRPTSAKGVEAAAILRALLEGLASIWPGRETLGEHNLGDVWRHPAAGGTGPSAGLVPFHKLSQWLAYSLFEPLERAGVAILQPGALTGLPEYRNGGLLVDLGVLVPRHALAATYTPADELIVEWRALTVALLDRVAEGVREKLGKSPAELPLANILEGGTWAAGREVARALRPGGGSPIPIVSDGTVF